METKGEIRERLLKLRRSLSEEEVKRSSERIKEKLFSLDDYRRSKVIMFYLSHDKEVDTRSMIEETLPSKKVLVPCVDAGEINPVVLRDLENLGRGAFGIPEPKDRFPFDGEIDLILVPGIAFDLEGYRIGYGKGYYDRFLKRVQARKIGLAYDFQVTESIPHEDGDVPVDKVITEKRIIDALHRRSGKS